MSRVVRLNAMPADIAAHPTPTGPRPEIVREQTAAHGRTVVEKPLSVPELLYNQGWLRKLLILAVLALIWEAYGRYLDNDLLFPTFTATVAAFARGVADGTLPARAWGSIKVLLIGYGLGIPSPPCSPASPSPRGSAPTSSKP